MNLLPVTCWLSLIGALSIAHPIADAFNVGSSGTFATVRPPSGCTRLMSTPDGDWDNDDFLDSLSGGGAGEGGGEPVERIVPENDMTDEEITMMAMRSAQFHGSDTPIDEVYGAERKGPPRKREEDNEGEFQ